MSISPIEPTERTINPLDTVEQVVASRSWPFDRVGDDELTIVVAGTWCDYHLSFTWCDDLEALQLACAFDMKVPAPKRREVHSLLALANERLWIGHFDLWSDDQVLLYRHGLLLQGGATPNADQCETLIQLAVEACERFYPAFQFVVWGGKNAEEAVAASMFDCVGEA